ncbi:MAG: IPT/TIG domain-containing protein [Thermoleophilaceae bacterium]
MRRLIISPLLALAVLAASAGAASAASAPVITSFSPAQVRVGQTLIVNGKNFKKGISNNRVFFTRASDGKTVRARPSKASSTRRMEVVVPAGVDKFLSVVNGVKAPTRFQLSVLSGKFSKKTPRSKSPLVLAAGTPQTPTGQPPVATTPPPPADCDADGTPDSIDTDDDNDLLSDDTEAAIHTDPCKKDTDGDGVDDVFEYYSALDLNSNALPYPGKRPYPNPLDGADAGKDFDADGLTLAQEFGAWVKFGNHSLPLNYSDGSQATGGAVPVQPGQEYLDLNNNGSLSDDEKDVDGDGLSNYIELSPSLDPGLYRNFSLVTSIEPKRGLGDLFAPGRVGSVTGTVSPSAFQLDYLDADTDGDGVPDGADDNDHDDYSNVDEMTAGGSAVYSDPIDPCSPNKDSRSCRLHPDPS